MRAGSIRRHGLQAAFLVLIQLILIVLIRAGLSNVPAGALVYAIIPVWVVGVACSWAGAWTSLGRDFLSWLGLAYHHLFLVWLFFLSQTMDFD